MKISMTLFFLLAGCSSVEIISTAAPIADANCQVRVWQTQAQALKGGAIDELCIINGTSSGSFSHTIATAIEKHKNKACACGASDVYVESRTQSGMDVATVTLVAFKYTTKK
jgi:hypothetical protein